ncbi:VOC family protein [Candidatus Pelagibacter sp.]|nr:VOC family protein [Candidatus Pelagibacter sp.]
MKLHHIGFVCHESDIDKFCFSPKKKFTYKDKVQKNKIIIGLSNLDNLWYEFIIPQSKDSTVYNFLKKNGASIHHLAYYVKNFNQTLKKYKSKKNFSYIRSFKPIIPCFGGKLRTAFFYNNNIFIEFLTNETKTKKSLN